MTPQLAYVDFTVARRSLSALVERVHSGHEHIAIRKHRRPQVVLVPVDDYVHYRELEDDLDRLEGMEARADFEKTGRASVSSEKVSRKLRPR